MNNSIRSLIDYLTKHNFDYSISPKILSRPAVKDFNNIVMFLFKQIDSNYISTGKLEDEVVSVFKHLGYPIQISKSNIAAVGSPHAWPSLLASIMWLIELLAYDEETALSSNEEVDIDNNNEDIVSGKPFFSYLRKAYSLFLSGEDEQYSEVEEEFISNIESKNTQLRDEISILERRNSSLQNEIEEVQARRAYLPELEQRKKDYLKDLGKFEQLIDQLEKHREQLQSKTVAREVELKKMQSSSVAVQQEVNTLRDRISNQEISPEDVKRMIAERERLTAAQLEASENRQALQRKLWETEIVLRDRVQNLDDIARAYTSIAEDLKLVPHTARNARGKHLNIEIDNRAKKRDGLLKSDVKRDIIPALQSLKQELSETTGRIKSETIVQQDQTEELDLKIAEQQDDVSVLEGKMKRFEEAYKRERESFDQAAEMHSREMDAMEARLVRLLDTAVEEARTTAAIRRATEARAARDLARMEHQRKKREMVKAIMDVVSQCASHRENVQDKLSDLKRAYTHRLEHILAGDADNNTTATAVTNNTTIISATASAIKSINNYSNYINNDDIELSLVDIDDNNTNSSNINDAGDFNASHINNSRNAPEYVEPPRKTFFNLNGVLRQVAAGSSTADTYDASVYRV